MKRLAAAATLVSCLLLVSPARGALDLGVGAYGVYQWPIAQDDAESGGLFGLKAKVGLIPLLEIEPNISWVLSGDAETNSGGTIKAPEVIAYQLNATRNDEDTVIDIYFRRNSGDDWMVLLEGAPVAGSTTAGAPGAITYEKSEELIQNFEAFATIAEDGIMELRLDAAGGNDEVTITDLLLIVTITAGT